MPHFVSLLKESPIISLWVEDSALSAIGSLSGSLIVTSPTLSIDAGTISAAASLGGTFGLDVISSTLAAAGLLGGGFQVGIDAGTLSAAGLLGGNFQLSLDAGILSAAATLFGEVRTGINPPSEDIKDILVAQAALSLTFATNIFIGEIPTTPNFAVGVFDTGGDDPDAHIRYERPTVQLKVRGNKGEYRQTHIKLQQMRNFLNGLNGETWNFARYISIWQQGDILFIGYDDNHRPEFTPNFRIHRTDS